jgi:hypothetical protein
MVNDSDGIKSKYRGLVNKKVWKILQQNLTATRSRQKPQNPTSPASRNGKRKSASPQPFPPRSPTRQKPTPESKIRKIIKKGITRMPQHETFYLSPFPVYGYPLFKHSLTGLLQGSKVLPVLVFFENLASIQHFSP